MMEKYTREIKCIMKDCLGIVKTHWNDRRGFKNASCPVCKTLFEPYLETRLRLMEVLESNGETK